jgi:hypothetical protein
LCELIACFQRCGRTCKHACGVLDTFQVPTQSCARIPRYIPLWQNRQNRVYPRDLSDNDDVWTERRCNAPVQKPRFLGWSLSYNISSTSSSLCGDIAVTIRTLSSPALLCARAYRTDACSCLMYALTLGKSDWPNLGRSIFQRGQRTRDLLRGKYSSLVRSATKSIPNDSLGTAHDRTGYPPWICRCQCDATPEASPWHRFWLFWYTYTCHLTY